MSAPACQCPSSHDLKELLDGRVADSDQAAMVMHLDQCGPCQQALESMAGGNDSLAVTLLNQETYKTPDANSAYWPALSKAEGTATRVAPKSSSGSRSLDVPLGFLDPPADSNHLGALMNFQVVRVVGRGGMGIVLQAIDTCLQRDVAIKVLDPELSGDEIAAQRFCREARAAASISHENVVAVHYVEHDEAKDLPFLVMELITGESLERKLEREGRLSLREIVHIGMQTAAGLAAAHEKGLIHRDIKPGNILLEQSGQRVKLTDFGLARAAEDMRLTRSGLVAGTPLYMSPEQATGEELDARSDLFSLGVVLYELAVGEPPFTGKTPLTVFKSVTEDKHVPLRERDPNLPEWFSSLVDRLLAKKPADRFQSAREVANTLEHFWALLRTSDSTPCPQKKAANPWKPVAIGVGAGLLTLAFGVIAALTFLPRAGVVAEGKIPPPVQLLKGNEQALWSLAASKDGNLLAMGRNDGMVKLWNVAGEKVVWTLQAHKPPVWGLAISPSGDRIATGSDDSRAVIWDIASRDKIKEFSTKAGVRAVAFDPDGKKLVTGDRDGSVKVWDVNTGEKLLDIAAYSGLVSALAFSPDGKSIASAGDKTIKIWDASNGGLTLTLEGHTSSPYSIAFSPDSRRLVSGAWDRSVRLWDLDTGNPLAKLDGHTQDIWSVDFDPAGTRFASAGEDQMVRIWDRDTMKELTSFRGSTSALLNVRFLPNTGLIVAAGKDGDARIWRLSDLNVGK